jgi:hypothetical protein
MGLISKVMPIGLKSFAVYRVFAAMRAFNICDVACTFYSG